MLDEGPQDRSANDLRERLAARIYETMRFDREDATTVWHPRGDSHAQNEARACAGSILDMIAAATVKPYVAIHHSDPEVPENYVVYSEGAEVFIVCENAPSDRIYRYSTAPIPDGVLDGPIGYADDGSPAETRIASGVARMQGRPHLSVVEPDGGE